MRIGIAYSLKPVAADESGPDDRYEEFDKPSTIEALAEVIRGEGHVVTLLGDGREFLERVLADPPDFVFNFAEGQGISRSREARVPAVCEMLEIPYSGSDPYTLSVALDKHAAKIMVASRGSLVGVPGLVSIPHDACVDLARERININYSTCNRYPLILKPAFEGSSKGIRGDCVALDEDQAVVLFERLARDYHQPVLVEDFIEGDEITVGVVGNGSDAKVIGIMHVIPKTPSPRFVYSLEVKRDWQSRVSYETPARLPVRDLDAIERSALLVYEALGCRDLARIDFRLDPDDNQPYFIEANPLPGLAPETSDLVILAEGYGVGYKDLIRRILNTALKRVGLRS